MAQNITLLGASYTSVPAVTLPKTGGGTARFDDASVTTATASDVASGKVFLASNGTITTGTASGGGGSSWTKVCEKTVKVNTTSTTAGTVETWATGHTEIWTSDKIVYVRIRDTAGKRAGYFYGSDNFWINYYPVNGDTSTSTSNASRSYMTYSTDNKYTATAAAQSTGYGVYADQLSSSGGIRIRRRYNSTTSLTINSTYKVEVYLLDMPTGCPIFT